jgi:hypothetical protein
MTFYSSLKIEETHKFDPLFGRKENLLFHPHTRTVQYLPLILPNLWVGHRGTCGYHRNLYTISVESYVWTEIASYAFCKLKSLQLKLVMHDPILLQVGGLTCHWQRHSIKPSCWECSTTVEQVETQLSVVVPIEEEEECMIQLIFILCLHTFQANMGKEISNFFVIFKLRACCLRKY